MSAQIEEQKRAESIDQFVQHIEEISDPEVQDLFKQLVQSLMDFHGAGIERMLEIVHETGDSGAKLIDEFGRDERIRNLLLLYGLHPVDLQTRVAEAVEKTSPYIRSHGAEVRLVQISETGAVTLRLEGTSQSCSSSSATLQSVVEKAIYEAAPDVTEIIVEGTTSDSKTSSGFVPLTALSRTDSANERSNGNCAARATENEHATRGNPRRSAM
ncbi:MAG: NifU family protein [Candidatus Acidiferrales bacterium]